MYIQTGDDCWVGITEVDPAYIGIDGFRREYSQHDLTCARGQIDRYTTGIVWFNITYGPEAWVEYSRLSFENMDTPPGTACRRK